MKAFTVSLLIGMMAVVGMAADWTAVHNGITNLDIRVIAVDNVNKGTVYAGGPGGVYKTTNGGANWQSTGKITDTITVNSIPGIPSLPAPMVSTSVVVHLAIDSSQPNTLYAATLQQRSCFYFQRRLFKSTDGGASWSDSVSPNINGCDNIHSLVLAPSDPATLYITNFDDIMGDTWSPLIKSTDGATSWTYLGFPVLNVLAVDPLDSRIVYAGTFDFEPYFTNLPNGVLKSDDGGANWKTTGLINTGISALVIDPRNPQTIYAASEKISDRTLDFRGLFKSSDGGTSWSAINSGISYYLGTPSVVTSLVVDSDDSNVVYLAMSGGGIHRSIDAGATWTPYNDGLESLDIRSLALARGTPNTLYAGTPSGVFKIIDDHTPVLSLDAPRQCVGDPWTLRLSNGLSNSSAKLLGASNGQLWEVRDWQTTDANGRFSTSGTFAPESEGSHTLRVELEGLLSNSVNFAVQKCSGGND